MTSPTAAISESRFRAYRRPPVPKRQQGAYAVVRDGDGRVLVVQAETGRCYLPGGRIEAGESHAEALKREIGEECGWSAEVASLIHEQDQPIFGGTIEVAATYWEARLTSPREGTPEHEMRWLDPAEALRRLHRAADRRALMRAI